MTIKERVIAAIKYKQVDRIPTTFRALNYTAERVMGHLGIEEPKNIFKNNRTLLKKLGADFWASGSKIDKFSTFVPRYNGQPPQPPYVDDGTFFYTVGIRSRRGNMISFDIDYPLVGVDPPLAGVVTPGDIKRGFLKERLELFNFTGMRNKYGNVTVEEVKDTDEHIVCVGTLSSLFMICCYLRGMENFLMDLAYDRKIAEHIIGEVGEFCLEFNRRELEAIGNRAVYYGTWDDVAGQNGMLFSPVLFKKYFLPLYKKLIVNSKRHGLFFGWHCCGSVHEVLPFMIDAGIDVFDVVQTSAKDMAIENIQQLMVVDILTVCAVSIR